MTDDRTPRTGILVLAIVALAFAVFVPALPGGWIYDDHTLIADNPHAHSLSEWRWWVARDFWHADAEAVQARSNIRYWRPLISASYAVDWTISDGSPVWFHLTNLLAHAAVALLAFFTLRRWTGSAMGAAIGAAVFAVHPTKAESVAWIAGRTDVLCTLAILVALAGVARRLRGQRGGLALEIAGTLAAYTSKEQAIVLPAFVLVEVWIAAGRPALDRTFVLQAVRRVGPHALLAAAYLGIRALVLPVRLESTAPPPLDHALAVFESIGRYVVLVVAPIRLSIQQGLSYAQPGTVHAWGYVAAGVGALLALALVAWRCRARRPVVSAGILVFGVALAPTSNIMFTGIYTLVSERFLYLPLLGLAWLAAHAAATSFKLRVALLAAVLVFAALSARRAADYADEATFWARELELHPESREARQYRALVFVGEQRYRAALGELTALVQVRGAEALDLETVTRIAELSGLLVPDLATDELAAIDQFAAALLAGTQPARLRTRSIDLTIQLAGTKLATDIRVRGSRLWVLRAHLASRRGDHSAARTLVERALALCPRCTPMITANALVLARAGALDAARQVIAQGTGAATEGPLSAAAQMVTEAIDVQRRLARGAPHDDVQRARLRAEQAVALELWGAAFATVEPYQTQLITDAASARWAAELAFRAGREDVARALLVRFDPTAPAGELVAAWTAAMGWGD